MLNNVHKTTVLQLKIRIIRFIKNDKINSDLSTCYSWLILFRYSEFKILLANH